MSYVPNTKEEQQAMLHELHMEDSMELYDDIPHELLLKEPLDFAFGLSELEVTKKIKAIAKQNVQYEHIYRGAGSYHHFIPSIVKQITSKEEFVTAYTPYQAEINQGILQSIFEYQTMICELTGMDVSNASVYDGASAAAEAIAMCLSKKQDIVYVSEGVDPDTLSVVKTYCYGNGGQIKMLPLQDGITDPSELENNNEKDIACVLIQSPNFYGCIEDGEAFAALAHAKKAKLIMSVNPISLAILKTPGECHADIAVGEGQPLGLPMSFGGPYLGFMACTKAMMRKLPGRIVGQTNDSEGNVAYCLTLQAREQHIRREKAGSNICSNEALCALTASVYLSVLGTKGLENVACSCYANAHKLASLLESVGMKRVHTHEFFHEVLMETHIDAYDIDEKLADLGILSGLVLDEHHMLWCATELNDKAELELLQDTLEILAKNVEGGQL